jgi:hypothetical protein
MAASVLTENGRSDCQVFEKETQSPIATEDPITAAIKRILSKTCTAFVIPSSYSKGSNSGENFTTPETSSSAPG